MSEDQGTSRQEGTTEEGGGEGRRSEGEGSRQGLGVLSAFREALEEVLTEAKERGEVSAGRAGEMIRGAMDRAREAAGGARERLDFVTHAEHAALKDQVAELRVRLENLERRASQDPSAGPSRPDAGEGPPAAEGASPAEEPPAGPEGTEGRGM